VFVAKALRMFEQEPLSALHTIDLMPSMVTLEGKRMGTASSSPATLYICIGSLCGDALTGTWRKEKMLVRTSAKALARTADAGVRRSRVGAAEAPEQAHNRLMMILMIGTQRPTKPSLR
jgi:hypothetical protein